MPPTDDQRQAPASSDSPRDQAIYWISRERLGTLDDEAIQRRDAWLAADPVNARQYRSVRDTLAMTASVPDEMLRELLTQPPASERLLPRRRLVAGLSAACAAAVAAGVMGSFWPVPEPDFSREIATVRGARDRVVLPDGSVLDLNTDTRARIAFYPDRREVELLAGEILFTVSRDKARPFLVQGGEASVRVTGTRFNVRRDGDRVVLAVEEGSVEFSAGPWWNRGTRSLTAGLAVSHEPGRALAVPHRENVSAVTAWQRGRLVFRDTPLTDVVSELNRYLREPLRLGDEALGTIRVAGTLPIDEPEAVLRVLPRIAPVRVTYPPAGGVVLLGR